MAMVWPEPSPPTAPMLAAAASNPYACSTCDGLYPVGWETRVALATAGVAIRLVENRVRDSRASSAHLNARRAAKGKSELS